MRVAFSKYRRTRTNNNGLATEFYEPLSVRANFIWHPTDVFSVGFPAVLRARKRRIRMYAWWVYVLCLTWTFFPSRTMRRQKKKKPMTQTIDLVTVFIFDPCPACTHARTCTRKDEIRFFPRQIRDGSSAKVKARGKSRTSNTWQFDFSPKRPTERSQNIKQDCSLAKF